MNRYEVTYELGKKVLLYGNSERELHTELYTKLFGGVQSIKLYTDKTHEMWIEKIKELSDFIKADNSGHEYYKANYYKGYIIVRLTKDTNDDTYYAYAEYTEYKTDRFAELMGIISSSPQEIYQLITINRPEYIVYSHRYYGEPKLSKPKELKNVKAAGKAVYILKKCEPHVFIKDNDVYIKHTDYFSSMWRPPQGERLDMPTSYYLKKYFDKSRSERFVYADGWGSIILRNEAWILLKNILPLIKTENNILVAREILSLQAKSDGYSPAGIEDSCEWARFWESVCNCVEHSISNSAK